MTKRVVLVVCMVLLLILSMALAVACDTKDKDPIDDGSGIIGDGGNNGGDTGNNGGDNTNGGGNTNGGDNTNGGNNTNNGGDNGGNGGDTGNNGDNGGEPIEQERPANSQELEQLGTLLQSKVSGEMIDWSVQDGILYVFDKTATTATIYSYTLQEGEGVATNLELRSLSASLNQTNLTQYFTLAESADSIIYDGWQYNYNNLGAHPFYPSASIDTRISVQRFEKIVDGSSNTGYSVVAKYIVGENDQTKAVYVRRDIPEAATLADMVSAVQSAQGVTSILSDNIDILQESPIVFQAPQELPPQPLDFTALENKLVEVIEDCDDLYDLNSITYYTHKDNNLYVLADSSYRTRNIVSLYSATGNFDVSTQDGINDIVAKISADDFTEVVSIKKSSSDITANGETYSKDGIEGDNAFARQCGVDNAIMTWVSNIGWPVLTPESKTHYQSTYETLLVYKQNEEIYVLKQAIRVECYGSSTQEEILDLSFEGNSYVGGELVLSDPINLGQNLKQETVE